MDEKYIKASRIDLSKCVRLATPTSPEQENLRSSLVPGMLEAINKNLRYYDSFKMFEMAQVFENGEYHPSSEDETLPIHKKYLTGCIVGKNAKQIFYEVKGIIESMAEISVRGKASRLPTAYCKISKASLALIISSLSTSKTVWQP